MYEDYKTKRKRAQNVLMSVRLSQNQVNKLEQIQKSLKPNDIISGFNYHFSRSINTADVIRFLIESYDLPA